MKKDKASCRNIERKPDVKTFYAASLCAKHCNGYYNAYNSYRCSCVEGECDEVEDTEFRESSIYTITKGKGPCLDAKTHLNICPEKKCNRVYSVDDTSYSKKFCPKTCGMC